MAETRLQCVSADAAQKVAIEADHSWDDHHASADGTAVVLTYTDKRYPLDVADWAFQNGYASDAAAADVIGGM